MHILVLTDRDWTHPQGGGTGTNLYGQVSRWLAWGHRVTVIAGSYDGAEAVERPAEGLEIHRMGTRVTVFPRAAWAYLRRGIGRDADVVLEVINGIAFLTPLWVRKPRVALVHHVHRDHYVTELGRRGALAAWFAESAPLRFLYPATTFITISESAREDLIATGVPRERIHVAYLGVEQEVFHHSERAAEPTLLYLGRLKQYKRIENILDVVDHVPQARLEIVGEGDHREALEAEVARRELGDRVVLHGFVSEEEKVACYGRAWMSLTASSAEGWCLTVMEAALCGTPSGALRVGGLPESIVDGETGVLADSPEELSRRVAEVMADGDLRDRLAENAEARARTYTWERTAEQNLATLEREAQVEERSSLRSAIARSEMIKAAGLAAAQLGANALALLFTIVFARLLGADGYGSLAALVSTFLILMVPGMALQVATARDTVLGRLGGHAGAAATLSHWTRRLAMVTVAVVAVSLLLREQLAAAVGVDEVWAAAAIPLTGMLWLYLSVQRGVLQGSHAYKPVGLSIVAEAGGRLVIGLALVLAGLGVAGAYLGTPLSMLATSLLLWVVIRRRLGKPPDHEERRRLRTLLGDAWAPILGLTLLAVLQNIDVILVKHQIGGDKAGSYAAAAVAAKAVIWVAVGVGLYLLPEATRRAHEGQDARPVLARAMLMVVAMAAPALAIFAIAPDLLLKLAFGPKLTLASDALVVLGLAMSLLAVAYLAVQYMLAMGRTAFLWILGVVAVLEPFLLIGISTSSLLSFATVVLGLQVIAATGVLALCLRPRLRPATS